MTAATAETLIGWLLRSDGQEDLCLATYRPSTGATRTSALITAVVPPDPGDRQVHGNATINAGYVLRAADIAQGEGCGLVLLHSHPGAVGVAGNERTRPRRRVQLRQPCSRTHRAASRGNDPRRT